ncbi:hypothetical protein DFJ73DRAFT_116140 [Zopfochytrium polystomum]|nr:hypothetical protein DFJ73DRAFT_116140 [Zopfochytrium polystomum]
MAGRTYHLDIDYITKLRFTISPYSNGKFDDNLNLEVAKDTNDVRLAQKYPDPDYDYRKKPVSEIPDAFLRQLFLFPSHRLGHGIGGIQNIGSGRWLEHDPKTGKLKTVEQFTGAPDQIFHCARHFRDDYEGTLVGDPRPSPIGVGADAEIGVLSFLLGSDGKPVGRPSGGSGGGDGTVVYDVAVVSRDKYNCDFEFDGYVTSF